MTSGAPPVQEEVELSRELWTIQPLCPVLMTILQSWSQGVEVWGRDGMRKLWSAPNIKVYGGGVAEA